MTLPIRTLLACLFAATLWLSSSLHRAGQSPVTEYPADEISDPSGSVEPILGFDFTHDSSASFHAHGNQVCASGCALSRHPTEHLTRRKYQQLVSELAAHINESPQGSDPESLNDCLPLETLLYFGRQTASLMSHYGTGDLPLEVVSMLSDELQKTHAYVSLRVTDESGRIRSWLQPTKVPLDRRHVFSMQTEQLQPLVTSGTVKRVGKNHVWTRL